MKDWKSFLYEQYVSSGQSGVIENKYAESLQSARHYSHYLIKHFLPADRNAQVIDLGCGTGAFIYYAQKAGFAHVSGVEISDEQIAVAHSHGLDCIEKGDILDYLQSLKPVSVNTFLLKDVIEHLTREELFTLVQLITEKLEPNGRVIIHVPNAGGIFGSKIRYADLTHEMAFTSQSIRQLFRSFGYKKVIVREDQPIVHGLKSLVRFLLWKILTLPFRLLHLAESGTFKIELSQNLTAVAER